MINSKLAITAISGFLVLGACSGPSPEKEFVGLCTPLMMELEEVGEAVATSFCECAGAKFSEHATPEEFDKVNKVFAENSDGRSVEKGLRNELGQKRYEAIGDHIDECEPEN